MNIKTEIVVIEGPELEGAIAEELENKEDKDLEELLQKQKKDKNDNTRTD